MVSFMVFPFTGAGAATGVAAAGVSILVSGLAAATVAASALGSSTVAAGAAVATAGLGAATANGAGAETEGAARFVTVLVTGFVDVGTLATTALLIYVAAHHILQRIRISSNLLHRNITVISRAHQARDELFYLYITVT